MVENTTANPQTPSTPMSFSVKAQYVKDLSFEIPHAPDVFRRITQSPAVTVNIDVNARPMSQTNEYEVVLSINVKAERDGEAIFVIELSYGAIFEAVNIPQEALQPALLIEAPRLIFPFARAIVSDLTRESSLPPLLIQPIDFVQLYQQKLGAQTAGQA
jgi:preprotein translocase subunit SecB